MRPFQNQELSLLNFAFHRDLCGQYLSLRIFELRSSLLDKYLHLVLVRRAKLFLAIYRMSKTSSSIELHIALY